MATPTKSREVQPAPTSESLRDRLVELEGYLNTVIADYEVTTEELKTSQEELTCANEELQSLNEDLARANREMHQTNHELEVRNRELEKIREELASTLRSAAVAIVVLGEDLRVRRVTPLAESLFHLRQSDVGRPARDVLADFENRELEAACQEVLDTLQPQKCVAFTADRRRVPVCLRPRIGRRIRESTASCL